MANTYDVIVLGLGAAGSSSLYHLSKSGKKVCGIDQYSPPHNLGSSHGQSRITRQAYHENPMYVPFIKRAYELWDELAMASGRNLFKRTGGIMLGTANSGVILGAERSAKTHHIPYEYLNSKEIHNRFPVFKTPEDTVGILETNAGILFPEECITANLELAEQNGATIKLEEKIISIDHQPGSIAITTSKGHYTTEKLIVAAGAWTPELMAELELPLTVERQVLFWFLPKSPGLKNLDYNSLPVYIWEYTAGKAFYGFPNLGEGLKIAHHHAGEITSPGTISKLVGDDEVVAMEHVLRNFLEIEPVFNYATTCMYTNTPDNDFIIDYHPFNKNIIIASPCSGHGFKFASVNGKILSDMALGQEPELDISAFRISRFQSAI
ncbi:MAG: N-methyl-L-tryptophan oxidase [Pedobacter sp.]|jgi:sarcosine oxidase|nr:N-methyl-L-tryptophan oxidase [Pedobacter sp.]